MTLRAKVLLMTVCISVPALLLGPVLFPPSDAVSPTALQKALLLPIFVLEAVALGLGVCFLRYGWPLVRRLVGDRRRLTTATYLASAWLLVNWWLHDNLHLANGLEINAVIAIDWAFHTTLIAAGAVICYAFLEGVREGRLLLVAARPGSARQPADPPAARVG